jgi:hypothetical protein
LKDDDDDDDDDDDNNNNNNGEVIWTGHLSDSASQLG